MNKVDVNGKTFYTRWNQITNNFEWGTYINFKWYKYGEERTEYDCRKAIYREFGGDQ